MRWKYFEEVAASNQLHIDLGALYSLELSENAFLRFGANVNNVTNASMSFTSPLGDTDAGKIPNCKSFWCGL